MWQMQMAYIQHLVLSTTGIITNKLHKGLKLLNFLPALHILMQQAITLSKCHTVSFW
jgi:hypothetical protein